MRKKVAPFQIYAPFQRINEEERTVEAYAFVNEVVDGEGGIRLKRTAMENATPDYMEWANVRRMHQMDAVGVAQSVVWDDKGASMTLKVIDDDAWEKVKTGVYKGLSVGVAAKVMRGKDVEVCQWYETSLVDRPKDPDAIISAIRAEGVGEEFEAETIRSFADELEYLKKDDLRSDISSAYWTFMDCLWGNDDKATYHQNIDEFSAYLHELVDNPEHDLRGMIGGAMERMKIANDPTTLTRLQGIPTLETEKQTLLTRAMTAEGECVTLRGELETATTRIQTLEKQPVNITPPVRFPQALERTFNAGNQPAPEQKAEEIQQEINTLSRGVYTTTEEQNTAFHKVQRLKQDLARIQQSGGY